VVDGSREAILEKGGDIMKKKTVTNAGWLIPKVYKGRSMHEEEMENIVSCDNCDFPFPEPYTIYIRTWLRKIRLCVNCARKTSK
jgi:hypothetical protein